MDLASNAITALVTLGAVILGGWLTVRSQDRNWQRDHARQWRDVRLNAYGEYLAAVRQYIAFVSEPSAVITAAPHPHRPGELMPFFDKEGRVYREQLEASKARVRLVSHSPSIVEAADALGLAARRIAAARSVHKATEIPHELFEQFWAAQDLFVERARTGVGLTPQHQEPERLRNS